MTAWAAGSSKESTARATPPPRRRRPGRTRRAPCGGAPRPRGRPSRARPPAPRASQGSSLAGRHAVGDVARHQPHTLHVLERVEPQPARRADGLEQPVCGLPSGGVRTHADGSAPNDKVKSSFIGDTIRHLYKALTAALTLATFLAKTCTRLLQKRAQHEETRTARRDATDRRRPQLGPRDGTRFDLVAWIFGEDFGGTTVGSRIVYGLVGLAAVYGIGWLVEPQRPGAAHLGRHGQLTREEPDMRNLRLTLTNRGSFGRRGGRRRRPGSGRNRCTRPEPEGHRRHGGRCGHLQHAREPAH